MADHKITPAVEMYLIAIYSMRSSNIQEPVPISSLAKKLEIQPVSANQMVRKMEEEGWVEYFPYKGVLLTGTGVEHALRVLRQRRLWEVFFVRELGLPLDEAATLACDLEHLISEKVTDHLDAFLEHPAHCFHGEAIPRKLDEIGKHLESISLMDMAIGARAAVMQIQADETTQKFLTNEGVMPGVSVKLAAIGSGGDCLIETQGERVFLSKEIASSIILRKKEMS